MATRVNLPNRTYDIAAFDGLGLGTNVAVMNDPALLPGPVTIGEMITGIVKLAQRFIIVLFLEQGSMIYEPTAGCTFLKDARAGYWRTTIDISQSFYYSLLD